MKHWTHVAWQESHSSWLVSQSLHHLRQKQLTCADTLQMTKAGMHSDGVTYFCKVRQHYTLQNLDKSVPDLNFKCVQTENQNSSSTISIIRSNFLTKVTDKDQTFCTACSIIYICRYCRQYASQSTLAVIKPAANERLHAFKSNWVWQEHASSGSQLMKVKEAELAGWVPWSNPD